MTSETEIWCAIATSCATGEVVLPANDYTLVDVADGQATFRAGDPDEFLGGARAHPHPELLAAINAAPLESLPTSLSSAWTFHPPIEGVAALSADVELIFDGVAGHGTVTNMHRVAGVVLAGGRFSVTDTRRVQGEDDSAVVTEEVAYDGGNLFKGIAGAPTYDAYPTDSERLQRALSQFGFVERLTRWVDSPFSILRIQGTDYVEEPIQTGGSQRLRITETYAGVTASFDRGHTIHELEVLHGVPHVVQTDITNSQGQLLLRRRYEDYRALATDVWRPFRVVESHFEPGSATAHLTSRVTIRAARILSESAAEGAWRRPKSANNWWLVRQ